MINEELTLLALNVIAIIMSLILSIVSAFSVGRHLGDIEYQRVARLNGIRLIQSWVNIRIHTNRFILAVTYGLTSLMIFLNVDLFLRTWISRILFIVVLIIFTVSSILDWMAERKQIVALMERDKQNSFAGLRVRGHALRGKLQLLYGLVDLLPKQDKDRDEIDAVMKAVSEELDELQMVVRKLDPNYKRTLGDENE